MVALYTDQNQDKTKISARINSIKDPDQFSAFVNKYKLVSNGKGSDKLIE